MQSNRLPAILALLALLMACVRTPAQQPKAADTPSGSAPAKEAPCGFLDLANATGSSEPLKILADGKELIPGGLPLGNTTGGLVLPAGPLRLTVALSGIEPAVQTADLVADQTTVLAVVVRSEKDRKTGQLRKKLAFVPVGGEAGRRSRLWVCSLLDADLSSIRVGESAFSMKRNELAEVPGYRGGAIKVAVDNRNVAGYMPSEPGSYVVLVYSNGASTVRTILLRRLTYSRPKWN